MKTPEILKLHFGRNMDGRWGIQSMTSIPLEARNAKNEGFYSLDDDLVATQPNFLGTRRFVLGQSIVPIVAHVAGEDVLRCLGTGFFVSCSGLLITAAHVISDPIERQYGGTREVDRFTWHATDLKLGVMIPLNPLTQGEGYIFRDIEWAAFLGSQTEQPLPIAGVNLRLTSDTAICKVAPIAHDIPHQPLAIVQSGLIGTGMAIGKVATAVGYGEMKDVALTQEANCLVSGEFSFGLHVSTGKILERFPNNAIERQVPTPGACFSAELQLPFGMSGSPIFDDEGIYVHGVVSRGWDDEGGLAKLGFGSMLSHSLHLPLRSLDNKSLFDLHEEEEHGFPKFRAPGA